ncbi:MAG: MBL fold metallo-hydrolase [Candidatus Kariarchaeaceae archaeon]
MKITEKVETLGLGEAIEIEEAKIEEEEKQEKQAKTQIKDEAKNKLQEINKSRSELEVSEIILEEEKGSLLMLGTGNAFNDRGRQNSLIWVKHEETQFLLDCGPGILKEAKDRNLDLKELDFVIISHFHGDHFSGLPFLALEYKFQTIRTKELKIIGPEGLKERFEQLFKSMFPGSASKEIPEIMVFEEIKPGEEMSVNGFTIRAIQAVHTPESLSLEIRRGEKIIIYSGDTEWNEELEQMINEVSIAIIECSSLEQKIKGHISLKEVKDVKLKAEKIVLTHLGGDVIDYFKDERITNLIVPIDGQEIDY